VSRISFPLKAELNQLLQTSAHKPAVVTDMIFLGPSTEYKHWGKAGTQQQVAAFFHAQFPFQHSLITTRSEYIKQRKKTRK
jgi:hypothetical protein